MRSSNRRRKTTRLSRVSGNNKNDKEDKTNNGNNKPQKISYILDQLGSTYTLASLTTISLVKKDDKENKNSSKDKDNTKDTDNNGNKDKENEDKDNNGNDKNSNENGNGNAKGKNKEKSNNGKHLGWYKNDKIDELFKNGKYKPGYDMTNPEVWEETNYINDINLEYTEVLMTRDSEDNYRAAYTYAGGERIGVEDLVKVEGKPNNPLYYLKDSLGSITAITNMNAEVIDTNRFAPYGEALDPVAKNTRLTNSQFGFTGEIHDVEADLVYLRARHYEPSTARFIQQDTYLGDVKEPLSRQLYMYAQGNPLSFVDPSGHDTQVAPIDGDYNGPISREKIKEFYPTALMRGDRGEEVTTIQVLLDSLNVPRYFPNGIDGVFGGGTEAAVNNFKDDNNIYNKGPWYGVATLKTQNSLHQKVAEGESTLSDSQKGQNYLSLLGFDAEISKKGSGMGVKTSSALIVFQYSAGIQVTGEVNEQTLEKLKQFTMSYGTMDRNLEEYLSYADRYFNWQPGTPTMDGTVSTDNGFLSVENMIRVAGNAYLEKEAGIAWAMLVQGAIEYNKGASETEKLNISKFRASGEASGNRPYIHQLRFHLDHIWQVGNKNYAKPPVFLNTGNTDQWKIDNKENWIATGNSINSKIDFLNEVLLSGDSNLNYEGSPLAGWGESPHGWGLAIDFCTGDYGSAAYKIIGGKQVFFKDLTTEEIDEIGWDKWQEKGKGTALTNEVRWLGENAGRFGFTPYINLDKTQKLGENYYEETWHWNYRPNN